MSDQDEIEVAYLAWLLSPNREKTCRGAFRAGFIAGRGDFDPFELKSALHELVRLQAERDAVGEWPAHGQAKSWQGRWTDAMAIAEELTRNEP